jgi:O-antigen ligase
MGQSLDYKRLTIFLVILFALLVAGYLVLPASLVNLAMMAVVFLPLGLIAIEKPSVVYCFFVVVLFSNIELYFQPGFFEMMVVVTLAVLAVSVARGRRIIIHDWKFVGLVFILFLLFFQSTIVARDAESSINGLVEIIKVFIFIGIIIQFVRNRMEFRRFILVAAVGILLCDLLPFIAAPPFRGDENLSLMWMYGVFRYSGLIYDANGFGLLQLFIIPLLIFLAITNKGSRMLTAVLVLAIFTVTFMVVLSFSRSSFLSMVFLLIALMVTERKNSLVMVTGSIVIVAGALFTPIVFWDRMKTIMDTGSVLMEDYAIRTRIATMETALILGLKHPLLGVGFKNFMVHSASYIPYPFTVHNIILEILSTAGFPAVIAAFAIVTYNIRVIFRLISKKDDPEVSHLGRLLLVQHIGVFTIGMFIPGVCEFLFWITLFMPTIAGFAYQRKYLGKHRQLK